MKITLSPVADFENDAPPVVQGDSISYRGETHDLSQLPEGAEVEADEPFVGAVRRVNGVIHLALKYHYDMLQATDHQSRDWADYTFDVSEGLCPDPIQRLPALGEEQV